MVLGIPSYFHDGVTMGQRDKKPLPRDGAERGSPLWEEADSSCALGCGVCGKVWSPWQGLLLFTQNTMRQPTPAICPQKMAFLDRGGGYKGPDWHRFTPSEWV